MKKSLLALILLSVSSCAPGLGTSIEVSSLPEMSEHFDESLRTARVNIRPFMDSRARASSIKVNDRAVDVEGELGSIVQSGFEEAIRVAGGSLCLFDCPAITGEILAWDMQVLPVFPVSKVETKATIRASVLAVDGKVVYTGTYSGKMSGEHPYYSEDRLLDAFGTAMNEAIESALKDRRFLDALNMAR